MEHHVVECSFDKPLDEAEDKAMAESVDRYLAAHGGRWDRSYYSQDRTRLICDIEAPDSKTVRQAFLEANCPIDSIWQAKLFESEAVAHAKA